MNESATESEQDPTFRQLMDYTAETMQRLHVPGVAIGILYEGKEYVGGLGVTNVDHPLPVDADTLFQIGSTTKTMTATAAMRLVEQGKLALDTPIREYLPDLRLADEDVTARATLRHIFTHTGGWVGDYFDDVGMGDDALAKIVAKMEKTPQLTPLGEIWSYCNSGFYLAGRVIEVVTGKVYEEAVRELVLEPLGLKHSFFFANEVITHRFAVGHEVRDEKPVVARPWALPRSANAAGGVSSTVKDQLRYARFHLGDGTAPDGTHLLTRESMRLMQSPLAQAGNLADEVGVTWMRKKVGGAQIIRHGGATNGQLSAFSMIPERAFAITILTNADRGGELNDEVVKWAHQHYLGLSDPEPVPLDLPKETLAPYLGRYSAAMDDIELSLVDGALVMKVTEQNPFSEKDATPPPPIPPIRLAFWNEDRVIALDAPLKNDQGEFLRTPDGSIAWLRFGGRIHKREGQSA
ncbi:MAG TPA: serine hydrolase domain-containing protein [Ktedonobacterales bacterium]|jgi:CubicO group peptidase (beta-lactamase class C family)